MADKSAHKERTRARILGRFGRTSGTIQRRGGAR